MIVHLNGELVPADRAAISPFDRGFIFGEGIYEGLRSVVVNGHRRVVGIRRHAQRMADGLARINIPWDAHALDPLTSALLDANHLSDAFIYWQVTRGTPPLDGSAPVRSRVPVGPMQPTVFGYCSPVPPLEAFTQPPSKSAWTVDDIRWKLSTIKATSLLGNVLSAVHAAHQGGDEAILIRDGLVTEGTYTNVVIVSPDGRAATPGPATPGPASDHASTPFLLGITRQIALERLGGIDERPIPATELASAREVLLLGTTTMVSSVVRLNGHPVADGTPGPTAKRLLTALIDVIRRGEDDLPTT